VIESALTRLFFIIGANRFRQVYNFGRT
jgi:hypothetical protein